jgi:two-component system, NtrC family, nitrogen regulation sensor histidine kinase NtrY
MRIRKLKEKLFTTPEHRRKVRNRIGLIIFLSIIVIFLIFFNIYQQGSKTWSSIDSNLNIFLLINLNIILLIIVIIMIMRNLTKLIYERRKRKLGFKLKYKLTLAFILISSLPIMLLFFIANGFLTNTLDFWFEGQFSVALKNSATVVNNFDNERVNELKHYAKIIAKNYQTELSTDPPIIDQTQQIIQSGIKSIKDSESDILRYKRQESWFNEALKQYRFSALIFYDASLNPLKTWFANPEIAPLWKPLSKDIVNNLVITTTLSFNSREKDGQIMRALVPLSIKDKQYYLEATKIMTGTGYEDLTIVLNNLKDHRKFLALERPIRTNYTTYLLLFTLLIIFGGTWFGYYLARSIVEPIETLVDGTRRISKGDLDFQIQLQVDDELNMLLDAFNAMTKELLQNRKKLAKSREELILTTKTVEERNIFVELVLQNMQSGIFSVDNSGYVKGINPYMVRLFQIKLPKTVKKHYRSIFTKEQIMLFEELSNEISNPHITSAQKDVHFKIDKKTIHISMELFQLTNAKGEQLGKLLVVDDLTELDRSTRARAWREVARRIAHEIKNPLTPIQLSAQRIRRKYLDQLENSDLLDKCTLTIINEVQGLKTMVNEFSKFARLPEIQSSPLNINNILEEVCNLFIHGLPSDTKLILNTDTRIPNVLVDAEQMKRVFTNLIDNAKSAIKKRGKIEVNSMYSSDLKMVVIEVIDDGEGISEHTIHRIFDPYVTTKKHGTGLGLAIVQQIIADHNGYIRVRSEPKSGTKFTIELPT